MALKYAGLVRVQFSFLHLTGVSKELLPNLVFEFFGHAAIWLGFVASIPSLNLTPVMTSC
jgi:hypothetical protein